jgi:hypothetical protein
MSIRNPSLKKNQFVFKDNQRGFAQATVTVTRFEEGNNAFLYEGADESEMKAKDPLLFNQIQAAIDKFALSSNETGGTVFDPTATETDMVGDQGDQLTTTVLVEKEPGAQRPGIVPADKNTGLIKPGVVPVEPRPLQGTTVQTPPISARTVEESVVSVERNKALRRPAVAAGNASVDSDQTLIHAAVEQRGGVVNNPRVVSNDKNVVYDGNGRVVPADKTTGYAAPSGAVVDSNGRVVAVDSKPSIAKRDVPLRTKTRT